MLGVILGDLFLSSWSRGMHVYRVMLILDGSVLELFLGKRFIDSARIGTPTMSPAVAKTL